MDNIIKYWFHDVSDERPIDKKGMPVKMWFMKDKEIDVEITKKFEQDIIKANEGEYKDWEKTARGSLALILLFDQFTRNIYRNTKRMFAYDHLACDLSVRCADAHIDQDLSLIQRVFMYMPFMHAEDLRLQQLCISSFEGLVKDSNEKSPYNTSYYESNLLFAKKHSEIIEQFGRFPHRNQILGRESTSEELEFLNKPGSSF